MNTKINNTFRSAVCTILMVALIGGAGSQVSASLSLHNKPLPSHVKIPGAGFSKDGKILPDKDVALCWPVCCLVIMVAYGMYTCYFNRCEKQQYGDTKDSQERHDVLMAQLP